MDDIKQIPLSWWNVTGASSFVLVAAAVSYFLGTKLELSLLISGLRCVIQLSLMGLILDDVLKTKHMSVVITMSIMLVLLGTYETVFNRTKKTFKGLFPIMLIILFTSNIFITYIGTAFVLKAEPFWDPPVFVPVIGMLLGNSMSSVAMATERCLDQFNTHAPMLETRLAFGASRYEAALPLAVEAIRLALVPIITQLSVMGMINIPGATVGLIMAGTPIIEAVIYQQCIMFMITASCTLGVIMAVAACMMILIDKDQIMRRDLITDNKSMHHYIPFKRIGYRITQTLNFRNCIAYNNRRKKSVADVEP